MRVGEVADLAGVTAKAVRFYERAGLLPAPARTRAGYRDYDRDAVRRIRFIKSAQSMGFTLGEIGEILRSRDRGQDVCEPVVALARQRLRELSERITQMERARIELRKVLRLARTCPPEPGGTCHVIDRVVPRARA